MKGDIIKYSMQSIVQYLNGDMEKFNTYRNKAQDLYIQEHGYQLGELIPSGIKTELRNMVS